MSREMNMALFFQFPGQELCDIAGYKIGEQSCTHVAESKGKDIQSAGQDTVGDSEPEEKLRGIDMLENAAVGVAVVTHRGKKGRFIFFGKVSAHGDGHGIAQDDCGQKRKDQITQEGIGTAPESQPLDPRLSDHAGDRIEKDQKKEYLRQNLCDPQDELLCSCTDDILDSVGDKHGGPP